MFFSTFSPCFVPLFMLISSCQNSARPRALKSAVIFFTGRKSQKSDSACVHKTILLLPTGSQEPSHVTVANQFTRILHFDSPNQAEEPSDVLFEVGDRQELSEEREDRNQNFSYQDTPELLNQPDTFRSPRVTGPCGRAHQDLSSALPWGLSLCKRMQDIFFYRQLFLIETWT